MIAVIDCGSKSTPSIVHAAQKENFSCEVILMRDCKNIHPQKYEKIILSGAPILLSQEKPEPYLEKFQWVVSSDTPLLGICFGHQIIGMLYGESVVMGAEIRRKEKIETIQEDPLFKNIPNHSLFQQDHCEEVPCPPKFIRLARSDSCQNEAMKHPTKPLYGCQFHPEVSGEIGHLFLSHFLNI